MDKISLAALVAARVEAKRAEDLAVASRRDIDAQIAERLARADKPEGAVSEKLDGFKVTVTYGVTRKVDTDALSAAWATLPQSVLAAFKWKAEASTTELRKLAPADAAAAAAYYTTSPASPQVRIELA